jgi:hypothetical protein
VRNFSASAPRWPVARWRAPVARASCACRRDRTTTKPSCPQSYFPTGAIEAVKGRAGQGAWAGTSPTAAPRQGRKRRRGTPGAAGAATLARRRLGRRRFPSRNQFLLNHLEQSLRPFLLQLAGSFILLFAVFAGGRSADRAEQAANRSGQNRNIVPPDANPKPLGAGEKLRGTFLMASFSGRGETARNSSVVASWWKTSKKTPSRCAVDGRIHVQIGHGPAAE